MRSRLILVRFCAGGYPQSLPGGATVSLGGARRAQVRFFINFQEIVGSILGRIFEHVAFCKHPLSECFFGGVQTRTWNDFGFVLEAFSEAFLVCLREVAKA